MPDLNPLKFAVAIQDEATGQLNKIEQEFQKLKDKTITVKVEGLSDLQNLLSALQHQQVQNIGKNVATSLKEATSGLQQAAQDAIRESLRKLAEDLTLIKTAIQNDNFTAFSKRIEKCAEAVNTLDAAFKQFHVTIGSDEGMRNFMAGLGEVIRNVRTTMGQLHGNDLNYHITDTQLTRSVNVAKHEVERLENTMVHAQRTIETFGDKGFNTSALERYKNDLIGVRDTLQTIGNYGGTHPLTGLTSSQYLSTEDASRIVSLLNTELSYYKSIGTELERITQLRERMSNVLASHPGSAYSGDLSSAIAGLDLRQGLLTRLGARDAVQSLNGNDYRQQIQEAVGLIAKVNAEAKQQAQDARNAKSENKAWAESIKKASEEANKLEIKLRALRASESRGQSLGVDTTSLSAYIAQLESLLSILNQIKSGSRSFGHTRDLLTDVHNVTRLANEEEKAVKRSSDAMEKAARNTQQLISEEQKLAQSMGQVTNEANRQSQVLSDLKSMAMQYLSVWGAQQFVNSIIETGGLLEQQRLSIGAILGDMEQATTLFDQIKALAIKSPFGVVELDKMSKQLTAYGFEYKELYEWTKRLADISAATGTEVSRLSLALGHVRSEGALSGYTLRQFAMANVPVLRMLSENMGISAKEVRERVRKKEVSYDDVKDILEQLTNDGGMFYNAQETMSEALNAKFKNLRDAFDIMYGEIAEGGVGDALKSLATTLTEMAKHWERVGKDVLLASVSFGAMRAATLLTNTALGQNTVATLSTIKATVAREQANLRLARASGVVTESEYRLLATNQTYTASSLKVALVEKKLTIEELQRAVALGKVDKAVAAAAVSQAGYDVALINNVRVLGFWRRSLFLAGVGIRAVGTALKSLWATLWPLLALTAVFEMFNRWQENKEATAETSKTASKYNGKYQELIDLTNNLADANKLSDDSLRENISTMTNALRVAGEYTDELQKQVEAADTLTAKYELLKNAIGGIANKHEETRPVVENLINEGLGRGSWFIFGDNVQTDIQDYQKRYDSYMTEIAKNGKQIKQALLNFKRFRGLSAAGDEYKTGRELYLGLSEELQESFLNSKYGDVSVNKSLQAIRFAKINMLSALREISDSSQMQSAAVDFQRAFETAFGVDLSKATDAEKREFDKFLRNLFSSIENTSKEAQDKARETVLRLTFGVVIDYEVEDNKFNEFLEDFKKNNPLGYYEWEKHSRNGAQTPEEQRKNAEHYKRTFSGLDASNVGNEAKKKLKEISEERARLLNEQKSDFYKTDAQERNRVDTRLKQIEEEEKMLRQAQKDTNQYGDPDKSKGSYKDKVVEQWKERLRVIREAYSEYDKWEKKVGHAEAIEKVRKAFDGVLDEKDLANIKNYRKVIEDIRKDAMSRYDSQKGDKGKNNGKAALDLIRETNKVLANIDMDELTRESERWSSAMSRELEDLKRRWEIYKSVRDATGDEQSAQKLAGIGAEEAGKEDIAHALESYLQSVIDSIGVSIEVPIDFSVNKSDKEIEDKVRRSLGDIAPEKIEAVTNAAKQWRDMMRDASKSASEAYSQAMSKAVDYVSQLQRINTELREQNRLIDENQSLSIQEKNRAKGVNTANANIKAMEASDIYKRFFNGIFSESREELNRTANVIRNVYIRALEAGSITAEEYAKKIAEIDKVMNDYELDSISGGNGNSPLSLDSIFQRKYKEGLEQYQQGSSTYQMGQQIMGQNFGKDYQQFMKGKGMSDSGFSMMEKGGGKMQGSSKAMQTVKIIDMIVHAINDLVQGLKGTYDKIREMNEALGHDVKTDGWENSNTFWSSFSAASNDATKGWDSLKNGNVGGVIEGVVGSWTSWITGYAKGHDRKRQNNIDKLQENIDALNANTEVIKSLRDRTLGYDTGQLRSYLATTYSGLDAASKAMQQFYNQNNSGSGYAQELANLKNVRQAYINMYNEEDDKKNSSNEALLQYKQKIAELDEQIRYFTEDLAKELWDIDFKSWADQLSDALCTAFENGESAAKAYQDTVKRILQSVMNKMLQMAILQPMFDSLQDKLFGNAKKGITGVFNTNDPKNSAAAVTQVISNFFGEGGEGNDMVTAALEFVNAFERGLNNAGLSVLNDSANTLSSSVQGTSEETSDLLAGYVNALRQDVAVNRILFTQFVTQLWPEYVTAFANHVKTVANIDVNVQVMMEMMRDGRGAMYDEIHSLRSRIDNVVDGIEGFKMR